jgi:hypothetical protein
LLVPGRLLGLPVNLLQDGGVGEHRAASY